MKFKLNSIIASALMAAGGAQAAINVQGTATFGNGGVVLVAVDTAANIQFVADLGASMSDFARTDGTGFTALGTSITWNFATNSVTGATLDGTQGWSASMATFNTAIAANPSIYQWAVVAGDSVTGTVVSGSNVNSGQGYLDTGNNLTALDLTATAHTNSSPTGLALGQLLNFVAANNNLVGAGNTHQTFTDGANTTSSANTAAWNGGGLALGNVPSNVGWQYLVNAGQTATFQWNRQTAANPLVFQLGGTSTSDVLNAEAGIWTFDAANSQLNWAVTAVPEPGTYAMLLAGLAAVGFVARRRRSAT